MIYDIIYNYQIDVCSDYMWSRIKDEACSRKSLTEDRWIHRKLYLGAMEKSERLNRLKGFIYTDVLPHFWVNHLPIFITKFLFTLILMCLSPFKSTQFNFIIFVESYSCCHMHKTININKQMIKQSTSDFSRSFALEFSLWVFMSASPLVY